MKNPSQATKRRQQTCAVCGWQHLNALQRTVKGIPSKETCPSCGFESGVTDDVQGYDYDQWRQHWVTQGMPWSSTKKPKPEGWNPWVQLRSLQTRRRPVIPALYLRRASELNKTNN